jgi:hypothetical protein
VGAWIGSAEAAFFVRNSLAMWQQEKAAAATVRIKAPAEPNNSLSIEAKLFAEKHSTRDCACRRGFTTFPPVSLQEQPAVVLLLKGHRSLGELAIREYAGHEDLRGSGRRSVIPYVHR